MGSKGGGSSDPQTQTSTSSPPPQVMADYSALINRATANANTPYQAYQGEQVAPLTPQTMQGLEGVNQYANAAQPWIQEAGQQTLDNSQAVTPTAWSGSQVQQYENPYTQDVVNATQNQFNNQNQQQAQFLNSNNISSGAFGGNRAGISQAILANQQQMAQAPIITGLNQANYNQATQEFNNQQQTGLQTGLASEQLGQAGAAQLGQLGTTSQQAGLQGATAQTQAGTIPQAQQQAIDTAIMNQYMTGQAYPFQTTGWLGNIIEGIGSQSGGTSTTTAPGPSSTSQGVGAAVSALGGLASFFSDKRMKENIEPIGKTFDGQKIYRYNYKGDPRSQIGLIAQDVEKKHPESVSMAGLGSLKGMRMVDYGKATEDSAKRGHFDAGGMVRPHFDPGGFVSNQSPITGIPSAYSADPFVDFDVTEAIGSGVGAPDPASGIAGNLYWQQTQGGTGKGGAQTLPAGKTQTLRPLSPTKFTLSPWDQAAGSQYQGYNLSNPGTGAAAVAPTMPAKASGGGIDPNASDDEMTGPSTYQGMYGSAPGASLLNPSGNGQMLWDEWGGFTGPSGAIANDAALHGQPTGGNALMAPGSFIGLGGKKEAPPVNTPMAQPGPPTLQGYTLGTASPGGAALAPSMGSAWAGLPSSGSPDNMYAPARAPGFSAGGMIGQTGIGAATHGEGLAGIAAKEGFGGTYGRPGFAGGGQPQGGEEASADPWGQALTYIPQINLPRGNTIPPPPKAGGQGAGAAGDTGGDLGKSLGSLGKLAKSKLGGDSSTSIPDVDFSDGDLSGASVNPGDFDLGSDLLGGFGGLARGGRARQHFDIGGDALPDDDASVPVVEDIPNPSSPSSRGRLVMASEPPTAMGPITPSEGYLSGLSDHPNRAGDVSNMNPEFAMKLAKSVKEARAKGIPAGLMSGYRDDKTTGSSYDAQGNSSHGFGLAGDVSGLDGPGGAKTNAWAQIAGANGLSNPYGADNPREFNHWQLPPQPLEETPDLRSKLIAARASGRPENTFNAFAANGQGATPGAAPQALGFNGEAAPPPGRPAPALAAINAGINNTFPGGADAQAPGNSDHLAFITDYAKQRGVDPRLAAGIANAEGLKAWGPNNPNAGSTVDRDANGQPFSFGDFQLNVHPGAVGDAARRAGIDPSDPKQWQAADKFAIDYMAKNGVGAWKGDPVAAAYLRSGQSPDGMPSGAVAGGNPANMPSPDSQETQGDGPSGSGFQPPGGGADWGKKFQDIGPSLMSAGFGMMAARSPWAMTNIGEGAQQGVQFYQKQHQLDREWQKTQAEIENLGSESRNRDAETGLKVRQMDLEAQMLQLKVGAQAATNRLINDDAPTAASNVAPPPVAGAQPGSAPMQITRPQGAQPTAGSSPNPAVDTDLPGPNHVPNWGPAHVGGSPTNPIVPNSAGPPQASAGPSVQSAAPSLRGVPAAVLAQASQPSSPQEAQLNASIPRMMNPLFLSKLAAINAAANPEMAKGWLTTATSLMDKGGYYGSDNQFHNFPNWVNSQAQLEYAKANAKMQGEVPSPQAIQGKQDLSQAEATGKGLGETDPSVVQGRADLAGKEQQAKSAAEAKYKVVDVPMMDGSVKQMTADKAAQYLGGPQALADAAGKPPEYVPAIQKQMWEDQTKEGAKYNERQVVEQRLNAMVGVLQSLQTGTWATEKGDLIAGLKSAGIDVGTTDTANPEEVQKLIKYASANVMGQAAAAGNRLLVSELTTLTKANANPDLQPGANAAILAQAIGLAKRDDQYYQDYTDWHRAHKGAIDSSEFETGWNKANPPEKFVNDAEKSFGFKGQYIPSDPKLRVEGQTYLTKGGPRVWVKGAWNKAAEPAGQQQ